MRLHLAPARFGRARLTAWTDSPCGDLVLAEADVDLDAESRWTRSVALHVASISGGEFTVGSVLRAVRTAQAAELAARWRR